jgi:hypothetical protein
MYPHRLHWRRSVVILLNGRWCPRRSQHQIRFQFINGPLLSRGAGIHGIPWASPFQGHKGATTLGQVLQRFSCAVLSGDVSAS